MWERRTTKIDEPDTCSVGGCQNVIQKNILPNSMAMVVKEVANHESKKRNAVKEIIMKKSWELKSIV